MNKICYTEKRNHMMMSFERELSLGKEDGGHWKTVVCWRRRLYISWSTRQCRHIPLRLKFNYSVNKRTIYKNFWCCFRCFIAKIGSVRYIDWYFVIERLQVPLDLNRYAVIKCISYLIMLVLYFTRSIKIQWDMLKFQVEYGSMLGILTCITDQ